jgi:hypothetical protein
MEDTTNAYTISFRKQGGKRPLTEHRSRWDNNIKMNLRDTGVRMTGRFI